MTKLLTAEQVAERLDMKLEWVWAQARKGAIPSVKLGRYRRFREETIDAWLRELEARSAKS
jgi:excisionase family DNA binding protein